jgi:hypothetical protein
MWPYPDDCQPLIASARRSDRSERPVDDGERRRRGCRRSSCWAERSSGAAATGTEPHDPVVANAIVIGGPVTWRKRSRRDRDGQMLPRS